MPTSVFSADTKERTRVPLLVRLLRNIDFPAKLGICERLFAARLNRCGICWVETAAGIPWKLDLRNATHRWIAYGKYEGAPFLNWAKRFLPRNGTIVDSGANIGQMLLYLAQWVPRGKVLAIEPGKHQADWLHECLEANPQLPVELIRVGLGPVKQSAFLEEAGAADRHGSWNRISNIGGEPIQLVPLSHVFHERGIENVDLWKLDVEGFEIPALEGAAEWLAGHKIRSLYIELRGENGRAIRKHLEPFGYSCHLFNRRGKLYQPAELPGDTNGLFFPN